ncbi:MAG: cyclic nucleotide-binding domain-containing protein [bacterium]|nr:cyclic nucleotide-binding domain-containing protein [bacterium]
MSLEEFQANDVIIKQGDEGDKLYLIREGGVTVSMEQNGASRELAKLRDGDFFGETALMFDQPRNATVTADEDVVLYSLGKTEFKSVLGESESFEQEVRKTLFARQ